MPIIIAVGTFIGRVLLGTLISIIQVVLMLLVIEKAEKLGRRLSSWNDVRKGRHAKAKEKKVKEKAIRNIERQVAKDAKAAKKAQGIKVVADPVMH